MELAQIIFLLGGHDLEMAEIRRTIKAHGIHYYDYNLEWNTAKLSEYSNVINNNNFFVGVELIRDITPPENYITIDNHNENINKSSSLEQVIEFLQSSFGLGIEMTRDLQLIAANDKGYIPAMLKIGATKEEVEDIRQRDRKAQGVTEEDERLAGKSIRNNLNVEEGITIDISLTSKFSTITDRLYPFDKLLIYTAEELTYYGKGTFRLVDVYKNLIAQQKAYSGGGKDGFFGISGKEIDIQFIDKITKQSHGCI